MPREMALVREAGFKRNLGDCLLLLHKQRFRQFHPSLNDVLMHSHTHRMTKKRV